MSSLQSLLTAGKLSDHYEIIKHLGAGAFSEVKLCTSKATGERCAVKVLNRSHPEFNEELLALEVEFMMRVKGHSNIVAIHAVYADVKSVYIVMEHMAGGELFDIIVKRVEAAAAAGGRPYSEQHVATIMMQLTSAIAHCHSCFVAHRDLKPENMLIADATSEDPQTPIKLADFGLSADIKKDPLMHEPCGTPEYVAPEVVTKFKSGYDKSCDVWSLGVIMYVLLCGYAPFWGRNAGEILRRVKTSKIDFPDREWSQISIEARQLVTQMLDRNPASRPTAVAILETEWIKGAASASEMPYTLPNLKLFNAKRKFRAGIEAILAENRMKEAVSGLRVESLLVDLVKTESIDSIRELATQFQVKADNGTQLNKQNFVGVLSSCFGLDLEIATKHFDAFCAFKDTPYVKYHEYCQACVSVMNADSQQKIDLAFELYDIDKNQSIDVEEFSSLCRNLVVGQINNQRSFSAIIREEFQQADADNDGRITLEEWRTAAENQERLRKYFRSISTLHTLATSLTDVTRTQNFLAGGRIGTASTDPTTQEGCACTLM